jgi:hypothetical protein
VIPTDEELVIAQDVSACLATPGEAGEGGVA